MRHTPAAPAGRGLQLAGTLCVLACTASWSAPASGGRRVAPALVAQEPIKIPNAAGRFDFIEVDPAMDRLLCSHTGNGTLDVFALGTGALIRSVRVGAAQSVAMDPASNQYYVTCSAEKQIVVVDAKTFAKTGSIALTGPPDLIALDTKRGRLYAGHDDASEVWVCDPRSLKVVGKVTFPSGEGPEGIVYDAAADRVYQTVKTDDSVLEIDPASNRVMTRWPTAPAKSPHGLTMDGTRHWLFSAGANGKLAVLDARTGRRVAAVDIASGVDQIAFDGERHRVYCGGRDGAVSVVEETGSGARLVENVRSAPGAKSIAIDPKRHDVWTCYGDANASYLLKLTAP